MDAILIVDLSLPRTKVHGNFRSHHSRERMTLFPGTFVPRSDNTGERSIYTTSNYKIHITHANAKANILKTVFTVRFRVNWALQ